jgi:hypothetical protein
MSQLLYRPSGYRGSVEDHLPRLRDGLVRKLAQAQKGLASDTLKLTRPVLKELAAVLIELAEDLHCHIGLWASLERHHTEVFGTSLPFLLRAEMTPAPEAITPERLQHLLWVLYPRMLPDLILAPDHAVLRRLAEIAAEFLRDRFAKVPMDSGVTQFLGTPDEYAWDVKRKLVWLGTQSYLFRLFYWSYVEDHEAEPSDIGVTDDFVCQECTEWAGLGTLEILAGVLDLPPERRADLLSWYERHAAPFEVVSGDQETLVVRNLVTAAPYRVRMNGERNPFGPGSVIVGSLVPWAGEWSWSGKQQVIERPSRKEIETLTEGYRRIPSIAYRYCKEDLEKARDLVREQYREFVARHGKDWVAYPDGLAMAADWQRTAEEKFASLPPAQRQQVMKKHGLSQPRPKITLPPDLLDQRDGIGVYFNPEEGQEIVIAFNDLVSGLGRRGTDLRPDEVDAIVGWIQSREISPGFVRRLAEDHGDESIRAAFLLDKHDEDYALEYLLRRYKGVFYRRRYPTLTLVK